MKKKHEFTPALDGKLEDRLVLSGARAAAVMAAQYHHNGGGWNAIPRNAILTTRTYNQVLVNIHRATETFGRSRGTDHDYIQLGRGVGQQLNRIPYARANGLTSYILDSLGNYNPQDSRYLYGDIRTTLVNYLSDEVNGGQVGIHKSPGNYFSDSDIWGHNALIYQGPVVQPEALG